MDPLSISASITALLQLTSTVIQYLNGVKGAPEDRRTIFSELAGVNEILLILQDEAEQAKQGDQWSSTLCSLNVAEGPLDQFRRALERLASKLAPPATGFKKLGKAITWPFQKEEIKEILGSIERQKSLLNLARQNDHVKLSRAIKDDLGLMRGEVDVVAKGVSRIEMSQTASEQSKIIEWLAAPDPSTNYNRALKDRNPKTGLWFIESSAYADWKSTPGSFLWLYGIPGCGKTILSSTILQNLLEECQSKTTSAVLYFYFDFNDAEKELHENLIRSMICQLSRCCVSSALQDLYSSCLKGGRQPAFEVLLETLRQMMASLGDIYIIIDALDECIEREQLLTDLEEMASWDDVILHILTTSRRETDIEESLNLLSHERNRISIQGTLVDADIRTYTQDRLQNDRKLRRWLKHPKVQLEIEDTLVEKAAGMFRWAACQLDSLENCFDLPHLRKALASLPRTLDETYARILYNIDRNFSDYTMQILKALQWLTFSARPLRLKELSETFAIDTNKTPRFDSERRLGEPRDILTLCSSLITLAGSRYGDFFGGSDSDLTEDSLYSHFDSVAETSNAFVTLAHFSVKEYLVSDRIQHGAAPHYNIQEIESHDVLARDCIAYLLQFDEPGSLSSETIKISPLLEYAAGFWAEHAKIAEKGPIQAFILLMMELFLTEREGFLNWIRMYNLDKHGEQDLSLKLDDLGSPLYYAALARLLEPAKLLIEAGKDVNAHGGEYGNALQAASERGYADVVHLLIENGADINARGGYFGNALQAASFLGYIEVVQLLLDNGADINAQGGIYGSALQAASRHGDINIVQLLLDNGADINAQGGNHGNALHAASCYGGIDIVQLLLDNGADINAQDDYHGTALQAVSSYGDINTVRLLLDNGADTNAQGGRYGSALQAASRHGDINIVQLLLDNGADINAQGGYHGNALLAALSNGRNGVAHLLLENGAHGVDDGIPLVAAHGLREQDRLGTVVKLLLEKGADVNAFDKTSRLPALITASERGHETIVKILLENGADVNRVAEESELGTALHAASGAGHENVVKILLENGADVKFVAETSFFGTALQTASESGQETIVKILLENGADVNVCAGFFETALIAACDSGHERIVRLLLEKGADIDADTCMGNAVEAAARQGENNIVKMLLDKGAVVDGTAMLIPAYCDRENVVKMLVAKGAVIQEYGRSEDE